MIIIDKFFRMVKLDRESFYFKYVFDEIMSNPSLAQDYPTVFNIQGTFSFLLHIFAKLLSYQISLHVFFCHLFIFFRITLPLKQILSGIAPVSKSIHFDLAQHFVGSD